MDFPGRLIAGLIAVILIVIFPLQYIAQSNSETLDCLVEERTREFTNSIREKGYLDIPMYEEYVDFLDATGELYDLEIEDISPVTGEEVSYINNKEDTFASSKNNTNRIQMLSYQANTTKDLVDWSDTIEFQPFAAHTHTADCFAGHNHTVSGCTVGYICHDGALVIQQAHGMTHDTDYRFNCATCGKTIFSLTTDYYDTNDNYFIMTRRWSSYTNDYELTKTNYFIDSDYGDKGHSEVYNIVRNWYKIPANAYTIYKNYPEFNYTGNYNERSWISTTSPPSCLLPNDTTSICDQVVTSITATNTTQTVTQGGAIITTATATYLDGHTGIVNCTSNFNTNLVGTQTVTLTYTGLVGNAKTTGTRSCTVTVTVNPNKTLTSLTVTPATQTINRYGTPSFTVRANYSNGTNKILTSGQYSMTGFNNSVLGEQQVTITFTDGSITKSAYVKVFVDGLVSISITPKEQMVVKYTPANSIPYTVTLHYMSGKVVVKTNGYNIIGYNPAKLGLQNITVSYTEANITKTAAAKINVTVLKKICPRCNNPYDLNSDDSDPGCPVCSKEIIGIKISPEYVEVHQGDSLPITVIAIYGDGTENTVYGWISTYQPDIIGLQSVKVEYKGFGAMISVWVNERELICPICGNSYPISEPKCPICATKVMSISVSPKELTVRQYEPINISVTAYYADESSGIVEDWSIDRNTAEPGTFVTTVKYGGAADTITLTVIPLSAVECPHCGLIYEPSENGKGCPICSETIISIEAYVTTGTNLVQMGTYPSIAVILVFRDEHRELATKEHTLENFDAKVLGIQTVTVRYEIFSTTIEVEVVNSLTLVTCPNGHMYYLNDDLSDPGCPFCHKTGEHEVIYYFDITYSNEILETVYRDGVYYFGDGNYITIKVTKKDVSLLSNMQRMFFKTSMLGRKKMYIYGGEVL